MVFPWAALGGLAGAGIDAAMGNRADRRNIRAMQHRIRWTVKDAQVAGIHPLAALGAPYAGSIASAPIGLGDSVGRGLASLERDPVSEENARLQNELLRAQVGTEKASQAAMLADARSRSMIAAGRAGAVGGAVPTGNIATPYGTVGNDPSLNPAADTMTRYGMIAGEVFGLSKLANDIGFTLGNWYRTKRKHPWPAEGPPSVRMGETTGVSSDPMGSW